jgi:hypothetical protein
MVVRIPATLVALALGLALDAGTIALSERFASDWTPIVLLPLWAAVAGVVVGRWSLRAAPMPGLDVGLLIVAVQIGLAFGAAPGLRAIAEPAMVMAQITAALSGGLIGAILARRASRPAQSQPTFTPLS